MQLPKANPSSLHVPHIQTPSQPLSPLSSAFLNTSFIILSASKYTKISPFKNVSLGDICFLVVSQFLLGLYQKIPLKSDLLKRLIVSKISSCILCQTHSIFPPLHQRLLTKGHYLVKSSVYFTPHQQNFTELIIPSLTHYLHSVQTPTSLSSPAT